MLQIFAIKDDTSVMNFGKNLQHNFPKMRGGEGGQRPFGTFPKIHPFWKGSASLRDVPEKYLIKIFNTPMPDVNTQTRSIPKFVGNYFCVEIFASDEGGCACICPF